MSDLITFKIDPHLESLWNQIGFDEIRKSSETQRLEQVLYDSYYGFVRETSEEADKRRQELSDSQKELQRLQRIFGDTEVFEIDPTKTLIEQKADTDAAIDVINKRYKTRMSQFVKLHQRINEYCESLGITPEDRGEFAELGDSDFTQERLERFKEKYVELQREEKRRRNLLSSLQYNIQEHTEAMHEEIPEREEQIILKQSIITEDLGILNQYLEELEELKGDRTKEVVRLNNEIYHIYNVLHTPKEDRIEKRYDPTRENLDTLAKEVEFLRDEYNSKLPQMIEDVKLEILEMCEILRIPDEQRPHYDGDDMESELSYYEHEHSILSIKVASVRPIIDLIDEIEELKNRPDLDESLEAAESNIEKKQIEEIANDEYQFKIQILERQLLLMLIDFKNEYGYDFEVKGVPYISTLSTVPISNEETLGESSLDTHMRHVEPQPDLYLSPKKSPRKSPTKSPQKRPSSSTFD